MAWVTPLRHSALHSILCTMSLLVEKTHLGIEEAQATGIHQRGGHMIGSMLGLVVTGRAMNIDE
jgi:hypothetical protein